MSEKKIVEEEGWKSDAEITLINIQDVGNVPAVLGGTTNSNIEILRRMGMKVNEPKPESPRLKKIREHREKNINK